MKNSNKFLSLVLIFLIVFSLPASSLAIKEKYPIRQVFDGLGYDFIWDPSNRRVTLKKGGEDISFTEASPFVTYKGSKIKALTSPIVKDGVFYVDLEQVSNLPNIVVNANINKLRLAVGQEESFLTTSPSKLGPELDSFLSDMALNRGFTGSVIVSKDGQVLLDKAYGYGDKARKILNNRQSRFSIGSITKQLTGAGIIQLEEKGLLDLNDSVSKYIPEIKYQEISIYNLLTHTSGLVNFTNKPEYYSLDYKQASREDVFNLFINDSLEFKPGEYFNYSNTNYYLLGLIIEDVSKMSYGQYMEENIFGPLNMKNTGIHSKDNLFNEDPKAQSGFIEVSPIDDNVVTHLSLGAGGVFSTSQDLYRWERALKTDKILNKSSIDKIFKERKFKLFNSDTDISLGFGWLINEDDSANKIYSHGGNTLGFTSHILTYEDGNFTVIILSNLGYYDLSSIITGLNQIVKTGETIKVEPFKDLDLNEIDYKPYLGTYLFEYFGEFKLFEKEGNLYGQAENQNPIPLYPISNDEFIAKIADIYIKIKTLEDGYQMDFNQMGLYFKGSKI